MTALADVLADAIKGRLIEHGYAMSSDTAQDIANCQAEAVAAAIDVDKVALAICNADPYGEREHVTDYRHMAAAAIEAVTG